MERHLNTFLKKENGDHLRVKVLFLAAFIVALIILSIVLIRPREEPPLSVFSQVTITVRTSGGTTDPIPSTYDVTEGSSFIIEAIPDTGWKFDYWLVEGERENENPLTVYPVSNIMLEVFFKEAPPPTSFKITIEVVDGNGTTDPIPGTYDVTEGSSFIIEAIPDTGWKFDYWLVDGEIESENPLTVYPVADMIIGVFFVKHEPSPMNSELVNTLSLIRENGFNDDEGNGFDDDELEAAFYVISKHYLDSPIENKQELIDYFDNRQRADGAWGERHGKRPKLSMYILQAYVFLDALPKKSLDSFFSEFDTWEKVLENYGGARSDKYHVVSSWKFYYGENPPWIDQLIEYFKESYDWITGQNMHERTHILYSYIATNQTIPNPDEIIDVTLSTQHADGSWSWGGNPVLHETVIQVGVLSYMKKRYPHRAEDIQMAFDKCKPYLLSTYRTYTLDDKTYGYFEVPGTGGRVWHFYFGVMGVVSTDIVEGTFWGD